MMTLKSNPRDRGNDDQASRLNDLMDKARKLLDRLDQQIALMSNPVGGTCAVFHEDELFHVALPWAGFEPYQYRIASRRSVPDPVFFTQLFDLVPDLQGRAIIDVGSYTGLQALVLRRFLKPRAVYMIEPQNIMRENLEKTIGANPDGAPIHLSFEIIGEDGARMGRAAVRSDRLSETAYIRKDEGNFSARSLDKLGVENVGLINLDIPGPKIYALKGATRIFEEDRSILMTNLLGRDAQEIEGFMREKSYQSVRVGDHFMLYLPK